MILDPNIPLHPCPADGDAAEGMVLQGFPRAAETERMVLEPLPRRASVGSANSRSSAGSAGPVHGLFSRRKGREYLKHAAFRRDNDLVRNGSWMYSSALSEASLPTMPPRMLDLLHIIWLLFERRGADPAKVDQVWMLCQSISRRHGPYRKGFFKSGRLDTPGLFLDISTAPPSRPIAPCVLPRGRMWANAHCRFLSGMEALQLQGVCMSIDLPQLESENDSLLHSIAGNGFAMPLAGLYLLVGLCVVASGQPPPSAASAAVRGTRSAASAGDGGARALVDFSSAALARMLVERLCTLWSSCVPVRPEGPLKVKLGTLCSGADFIVPFAQALVTAINEHMGTVVLALVEVFGCEVDPRVRRVRRHVVGATSICYTDVHSLPLASVQKVDILMFGSSCKSLSQQNNHRVSLLADDPEDASASSGATMKSCLRMSRFIIQQSSCWRTSRACCANYPGKSAETSTSSTTLCMRLGTLAAMHCITHATFWCHKAVRESSCGQCTAQMCRMLVRAGLSSSTVVCPIATYLWRHACKKGLGTCTGARALPALATQRQVERLLRGFLALESTNITPTNPLREVAYAVSGHSFRVQDALWLISWLGSSSPEHDTVREHDARVNWQSSRG